MRSELLLRAAELVRKGEPFVLATVTWRQAPSSAQRGDSALITADGTFHGWLGGACTRPTVESAARLALRDGQPRLLVLEPETASMARPLSDEHTTGAPEPRFEPRDLTVGASGGMRAAHPPTSAPADALRATSSLARPGVDVHPMTCHSGGSVEIYLEPVLPPPRLVVFGGSPAARTLARLGQAMGYAVAAVAPQPDFAGFPPGVDLRTAAREGDRLQGSVTQPLYAVVATMGDDDEAGLRAALGLRAAYVGVVASRRRFAEMRATLQAGGVAAAALDAVRSPAGLDLGGRTPEEIALSILAEIVQLRRSGASSGGDDPFARVDLGGAPAILCGDAVEPTTAIDPICGMTVEVSRSRHQAEHAGTTYYFCCGGCRERFLADPERWVAAEAGG